MTRYAPVAQLDRAQASDAWCRRFKSCSVRHKNMGRSTRISPYSYRPPSPIQNLALLRRRSKWAMACAGCLIDLYDYSRKHRFKILFGALTLLRLTSIRPRDPLYSFDALHLPDSEPRPFATQEQIGYGLRRISKTISSTARASIGSKSCSASSGHSSLDTPLPI